MKQHSTINSRIRKLWPFVVVFTVLMLSSALLVFGTAADNVPKAPSRNLGNLIEFRRVG